MSQEITNALLVIVLTQHIREYLELYDPQALAQAIAALTANDPGFPARLAEAGESARVGASFAENQRRTDVALSRTPLTWAIDYWNEIGRQISARSTWSLYAESGTDADKVGIEGTGLTLAYTDHWGKGGSIAVELPDNPTWRQLYRAADDLIRKSGDGHHTFIEGIDRCGDSSTYTLSTGS